MHCLGPMSVPGVVAILDGVSEVGCYINVVVIVLVVHNHLVNRKKG